MATHFDTLGLHDQLLDTLSQLGYESPTPIQARSIPTLLEGHDLLAQAQTGTGKTAAFALPILSHLDLQLKQPQALVIAPTRELAIQVAEAMQSYAKALTGFQVTPIYGGQDYQVQLKALKRGAHVIVGTPGRVMDHLRRGTLKVNELQTVVLDEADEMLKMGFIDDIEWILEQIPHDHQTALFSATLPPSIQKIANRYLNQPEKIHIQAKQNSVDSIEQFYTKVNKNQKLDALTRFLEVETIQAAIIFARTKNVSAELAEKLQARGYAAAALNGDMNQSLREKVIQRIKKGTLDIIVATDVAARGIDVDRITHVINYDIPYDVESYIHRIGRTGRAGRQGKALLFVSQREQRMLRDIERAIRKPITQIEPPTLQEMAEKRDQQLAEKILASLEKLDAEQLEINRELVTTVMRQQNCDAKLVAAALVALIQAANPLPTKELARFQEEEREATRKKARRGRRERERVKQPRSKASQDGYAARATRRKPTKKSDRGEGDWDKPHRHHKKTAKASDETNYRGEKKKRSARGESERSNDKPFRSKRKEQRFSRDEAKQVRKRKKTKPGNSGFSKKSKG